MNLVAFIGATFVLMMLGLFCTISHCLSSPIVTFILTLFSLQRCSPTSINICTKEKTSHSSPSLANLPFPRHHLQSMKWLTIRKRTTYLHLRVLGICLAFIWHERSLLLNVFLFIYPVKTHHNSDTMMVNVPPLLSFIVTFSDPHCCTILPMSSISNNLFFICTLMDSLLMLTNILNVIWIASNEKRLLADVEQKRSHASTLFLYTQALHFYNCLNAQLLIISLNRRAVLC